MTDLLHQTLLEKLNDPSGVPEYQLSREEQIYLRKSSSGEFSMFRDINTGTWRWLLSSLEPAPPKTFAAEAAEVSTFTQKRNDLPVGTFSYEELLLLKRQLLHDNLTYPQQASLLETALQLANALAETKRKSVAPLDAARDRFGINFMGKEFLLMADFKEKTAGTHFLLVRMNPDGTMFCRWHDGSSFELEYDWLDYIDLA